MDETFPTLPQALPDWLSEGYFRSLFRRKSPGKEVAIQNVTLNFANEERIHGKLVRAVVDVASQPGIETHTYIVKSPGPGHFSSTPACTNMYRNETLILGEVIPAMEHVLEAVSPGRFGQLAPRLVDYDIDEKRFIMTEDLTVQGFSTVPRQKGMDLEHSLAYAKHLGVFHGSSVAILDRFESAINSIPLLVDLEESKNLNGFIETSLKGVVSVLESWEDGSQHVDKVRQLAATLPQRLAQANRRRDSSRLKVLCHGDMFVNNILFRHGDNGNVTGVRLVDFQLSRVGSFADDLSGFLVSAVSDEVLVDHWEELVEAYRGALNEVLHLLGLGGRCLSQDAVRQELREQRAVAQFAAFHMLPHSRAPGNVDLHTGGDAFSSPAYQRLLRVLLPRFHALGWLDEFEERHRSEQSPSLPNNGSFQIGLRGHQPAAFIMILSFLVTKLLEFTTLHQLFAPAVVGSSFSSEIEPGSSQAKCLGGGLFQTTTCATNPTKMETTSLRKVTPVAEETQKNAVQMISDFTTFRTSNYGDNKIPINNATHALSYDLRPMKLKKILDVKHYLAFIRVLASLYILHSFILKQTPNKISNYPGTDFKRFFEGSINSPIENSISQSQTQAKNFWHTKKGPDQEIYLLPLILIVNTYLYFENSIIFLGECLVSRPQAIFSLKYKESLISGNYFPYIQFQHLNPLKGYISKVENVPIVEDPQNKANSLPKLDRNIFNFMLKISEYSDVEISH